MTKEDKINVVQQTVSTIGEYANFYIIDIAMLNASITNRLRRECYLQKIKVIVIKNTLLKKALKQLERDFSALDNALKGNTAVMFSNSVNKPAKLIKMFSDEKIDIIKFKAAYIQEDFYLGSENLNLLVTLKSKNELIGDIITLLQFPMKKIVLAINFRKQTIYEILKILSQREENGEQE